MCVRDFAPQDCWDRFQLNQSTFYTMKLVSMTLTFLCFDLERFRDHFYSWDPPMAVGKSGLGFAVSQSIREFLHKRVPTMHCYKNFAVVAPNELKMVPAVTKQEIAHVHKISAQSEQLRLRYGHFYWFLEKTQLRYVSSGLQKWVPGVV